MSLTNWAESKWSKWRIMSFFVLILCLNSSIRCHLFLFFFFLRLVYLKNNKFIELYLEVFGVFGQSENNLVESFFQILDLCLEILMIKAIKVFFFLGIYTFIWIKIKTLLKIPSFAKLKVISTSSTPFFVCLKRLEVFARQFGQDLLHFSHFSMHSKLFK